MKMDKDLRKDLCSVLTQILLTILGGACVGIGTESAWVGAGVAIVGAGVAGGPLFWALFDRVDRGPKV
jgi:hypothetical protein